jgi:hypothetical protein
LIILSSRCSNEAHQTLALLIIKMCQQQSQFVIEKQFFFANLGVVLSPMLNYHLKKESSLGVGLSL